MRTFTPDDSDSMANAIGKAYGKFLTLQPEAAIFDLAENTSEEYDGGCWNFVANDDGDLGFWYPTDKDTYAVSCENYYENKAMDARAFGAALTLVTINQLIWSLYHLGNQAASQVLSDKWHALRNWIFDLSEQGSLDGQAIAAFID